MDRVTLTLIDVDGIDMGFNESLIATSKQIVAIASAYNVDVRPICNEYGVFESRKRLIEFWFKDDSLRYHLSGEISIPPAEIGPNNRSFQGIWDETGSIPDLEQAFQLLRAWLVECKEIDELPDRTVLRWMI